MMSPEAAFTDAMVPEPVKFLLVDDLEENLLALEALLRRDGLQMYKARSGNEALELLLAHDFALALLDVQMPEMDGFELAALMRGIERTRRVPIIFVTAAATDESRRFRGYEAGAVDFIYKPLDPLVLKSKAKVFFDIALQHQQLDLQKRELAASSAKLKSARDRLQAHTDNSPLAIVEFDPDLRLLAWSKGAERMFGWTAEEMVGHRLADLGWLSVACMDEMLAQISASMADASHRRGHEEVKCRHRDGAVLECEWYSSVLRDARGKPLSFNAQILDVTAKHRAEETRRLLIGELNHRVKNTLASVQAIATQTLRHTRNLDQFSATFLGRIQALARAHGMLSDTTWQGANLKELIHDQLRLGTIEASRLSATGPEVRLAPQMALRLALILHELSTNAIKYGAFSTPGGRVSLSWSVQGKRLRLSWQESGGPPVKAPAGRGFGSTLIEGSIQSDGGIATATYGADGVVWQLEMPLGDTEVPVISRSPPASDGTRKAAGEARNRSLAGRTFLVVEDEALVALELISVLEDAGARVVGPAGTIADAIEMAQGETFDAAFLDGNLNGTPVDAVASALTARGIPFGFVSGYGRESLPPAFAKAPLVNKPFSPHQLLTEAARLTAPDSNVIQMRPSRT